MQPTRTPIVLRGRRLFAACALAGSLAVGLSACGSSGSTAAAGSSNSGSTSASSNSRYQARLKAAECLRAHGLNVPDPSATGGGGGGGAGGGAAGGGGAGGGGGLRQLLATPAGVAASKACKSQIGAAFSFASITPAQRQQFQQAAVKFAECMRAHNVNIPDPSSNGAGGFGIFRSIPSSERNSPAFKTAFSACSSNLPARPGRAGGAGGPGGAGGTVGGPGA
ncbi:MAG TPA: hypothetical protein VG186_19280 [Solirubrobacteraceae bacterium]|jgi:hypothetical protein|nr:hypothetical protein [Solirubrobacteraceae bacterium]